MFIRYSFYWTTLLFLGLGLNNIIFAQQIIYHSNSPKLDSPAYRQNIRDQIYNFPHQRETIIQHLKEKELIIDITDKFSPPEYITTLESENINVELTPPRLLAIPLENNSASGIFTLDPIETGSVIAEYITNNKLIQNSGNTTPSILDTSNIHGYIKINPKTKDGNECFVLYLPSHELLSQYKFSPDLPLEKIAMANSKLQKNDDGLVFLIATRCIQPFEQIGVKPNPTNYDKDMPYFLDTDGNTIPEEKYYKITRDLIVKNKNGKEIFRMHGMTKEKILEYIKDYKLPNEDKVVFINPPGHRNILVNVNELFQTSLQPGTIFLVEGKIYDIRDYEIFKMDL